MSKQFDSDEKALFQAVQLARTLCDRDKHLEAAIVLETTLDALPDPQ